MCLVPTYTLRKISLHVLQIFQWQKLLQPMLVVDAMIKENHDHITGWHLSSTAWTWNESYYCILFGLLLLICKTTRNIIFPMNVFAFSQIAPWPKCGGVYQIKYFQQCIRFDYIKCSLMDTCSNGVLVMCLRFDWWQRRLKGLSWLTDRLEYINNLINEMTSI